MVQDSLSGAPSTGQADTIYLPVPLDLVMLRLTRSPSPSFHLLGNGQGGYKEVNSPPRPGIGRWARPKSMASSDFDITADRRIRPDQTTSDRTFPYHTAPNLTVPRLAKPSLARPHQIASYPTSPHQTMT